MIEHAQGKQPPSAWALLLLRGQVTKDGQRAALIRTKQRTYGRDKERVRVRDWASGQGNISLFVEDKRQKECLEGQTTVQKVAFTLKGKRWKF